MQKAEVWNPLSRARFFRRDLMTIARRFLICAFWLLTCAFATPASAQHEHHAAPTGPGWNWKVEAQAFVNVNLQERKFRDFHVIESQNWFMTSGAKTAGRGRFSLHGMISFEPWTMKDIGSPQVFQTGETFNGTALVDYQHPHDFVMEASARFDWPLTTGWRLHFYGGPVGSPAIGPTVFMHRASAESNPTAPLGASLPGLDAHHARRRHGGRHTRSVHRGSVGVPRARARRGSCGDRVRSDRQLLGADPVEEGRLGGASLRRSSRATGSDGIERPRARSRRRSRSRVSSSGAHSR